MKGENICQSPSSQLTLSYGTPNSHSDTERSSSPENLVTTSGGSANELVHKSLFSLSIAPATSGSDKSSIAFDFFWHVYKVCCSDAVPKPYDREACPVKNSWQVPDLLEILLLVSMGKLLPGHRCRAELER